MEAHIRDRRLWDQYTKGMPESALTYIDDIQPFRRTNVEDNSLAILARLHNADKHRELTPVVQGLAPTWIRVGGDVRPNISGLVVRNGAEVARIPGPLPLVAPVDVEAEGSLKVAVRGGRNRLCRLPSVCETILGYVEERVVPDLEIFVVE